MLSLSCAKRPEKTHLVNKVTTRGGKEEKEKEEA